MKEIGEQTSVLSDVGDADQAVTELLLDGLAQTVADAEEIYLNSHLSDVLRLVSSPLSDEEFRSHPLISLLISHGSRNWDDALG